ncbi:hypothetical protein LTR53_018167, partial [Teratosphaeriaceae sp. CCFEE 6253]
GLEKLVREAEVDVNYAVYFPLEREYVPLFAVKRRKEGTSGLEDRGEGSPEPAVFERKGDTEVWRRVQQCMADGTLEAMRNGMLDGTEGGEASAVAAIPAPAQPTTKKKREKAKKPPPVIEGNRRERRKAAVAAKVESDDDSEGGFFE